MLAQARRHFQELLMLMRKIEIVLNNCPLTVVYYDAQIEPLIVTKVLGNNNEEAL